MPKIPSLEELLKAGAHFGHKTSRWHPKMAEFIHSSRGGVHIVDLEKTQVELAKTLEYVKGVASRGGVIMFVGTKRQAQKSVREYAEACGMPHVTERWLGGTITNFEQIRKSLRKLKTYKEQRDKGELRKYTKKEQLLISREIEELEVKIGGIQDITKTPEAIFVVDAREEKTAVLEANSIGVKVVAIADTNVNPTRIQHVIPANDDSVGSIKLITRLVSEAIQEGKAAAVKAAPAPKAEPESKPKPARTKPAFAGKA